MKNCETQINAQKVPYKTQKLPLVNLDWNELVTHISRANTALARYSGRLEGIPNPQLLFTPLVTQEAVLSSRIEGTQATLEEVLEYETDPKRRIQNYEDVEEVINYEKAIEYAEKELAKRPMCVNLIREMHGILLNGVRGQNKGRGELRRIQNWIGKPGSTIETATYVPPSPADVPNALSNLEKYYHSEDKDPLVQVAIIHAQFELIHPFLDGNGRLGRILIPLFLFEKEMIYKPTFYLSEYIESTRQHYYQALNSVSATGNWLQWVQYFLSAIEWQADKSGERIKQILELYREMEMAVADATRSKHATKTLHFIFRRPIFSSTEFTVDTEIPKPTAARIVKGLLESDIVEESKPARGTQTAIYRFPRLLEVINN